MKTKLRFAPWRGINYGTPKSIFSRPTFILAGSTYADGSESTEEEDADWTNQLVDYYFDGGPGRWKKTYTTFINSVYGDDSSTEMRHEFFDSILFNNFLQDYAGTLPGHAAGCDYHADHHFEAFLETIRKHKPEVVISWGSLVWDALRNDWGYGLGKSGKPIVIQGQQFDDYWTFPFEKREILVVRAKHPSTGYSRDFHHALFKRLRLLNIKNED
jgi:hypothetical protein